MIERKRPLTKLYFLHKFCHFIETEPMQLNTIWMPHSALVCNLRGLNCKIILANCHFCFWVVTLCICSKRTNKWNRCHVRLTRYANLLAFLTFPFFEMTSFKHSRIESFNGRLESNSISSSSESSRSGTKTGSKTDCFEPQSRIIILSIRCRFMHCIRGRNLSKVITATMYSWGRNVYFINSPFVVKTA